MSADTIGFPGLQPARLLGLGALALILLGCSVDRFPLPDVAGVEETGFGAGDSSYLLLNRQIDLPAGAAPTDMFIDDDGHIYVAESGSGRISVWDQSLAEIGAPGLEGFTLPGIKGLSVGPEQLLFAVAGDSSLWALNLQANRETLNWGMSRAYGVNERTGVADTLDAEELAAAISDRTIWNWTFSWVDSLDLQSEDFQAQLRPHVLWSGSSSTRLQGVAHGRAGKREVFLANNNPVGNRINRLRLRPTGVLFTANPDVPVVYLYGFKSLEVVAYSGTGVGTVDSLLSLDADTEGSLFLTQAAPQEGYWKAQRMTVEEFAGVDYWSFDFALQGRSLMSAEQLQDARDITYTASNMFVVDRRPALGAGADTTDTHRVQVFKRNGDFMLPLGARKVQLSPSEKVWVYDQLQDPRAVAVYGNRSNRAGNEEEIVFVADGDHVKLFMLSVSTDDLPVQ
jgi:hypothetical protein